MKINGLILAAGLSSRMGKFKPLMDLGNKTLIESSIDSMLKSDVSCVTVVLGYRADDIKEALKFKYLSHQVKFSYNPLYAKTDMLFSIKIGLKVLAPCDMFFLLPGDMPVVKRETFIAVKNQMQKTGAAITFPTISNHRKHPPLISKDCINDILNSEAEGGLRQIWNKYENEIAVVPVDDIGCEMDADTMEDYRNMVRYINKKY